MTKKKPLTTKVINQKPDKRLKVVSNQRLHREWLVKQPQKKLKERKIKMVKLMLIEVRLITQYLL